MQPFSRDQIEAVFELKKHDLRTPKMLVAISICKGAMILPVTASSSVIFTIAHLDSLIRGVYPHATLKEHHLTALPVQESDTDKSGKGICQRDQHIF
jgi:hypothetical protein